MSKLGGGGATSLYETLTPEPECQVRESRSVSSGTARPLASPRVRANPARAENPKTMVKE